jgi:hypothetical protein
MKKLIVASVLGIAASIAVTTKTQAQGNIIFGNYNNSVQAPVTFSGAPSGGLTAGEDVGSEFSLDLLYSFGASLGTTYTDESFGQTYAFYGTDGGSPGTDGAGLVQNGLSITAQIPGYTTGTIDIILEAYNGATYTASTIRGQSGVVQLSNLATAVNHLTSGDLFSDNGSVVTPLTAFTVSPAVVPEPTTLALAGLGGAALLALRRKKA